MSSNMLFIGTIVNPEKIDNINIFDGFVAVQDGKITKVGNRNALEVLESDGAFLGFNICKMSKKQFLMPGLVDCHTHAPQFPNLGLGLDKSLLEWLETYTFPLEAMYEDAQFAARVYDNVVKTLLKNGTTTASYFGSIHYSATMELVKIAVKRRQRALIGKVSMNIWNESGYFNETQKELQEVELFLKTVQNGEGAGFVTPVITPRFAISCDETLMTELAALANKYKVPIQSHISENLTEVQFVKEAYSHRKHYADVYDKCGLLNNRCIMAHAIHLSDSEMELLCERGVSIAHCPASNTRLQSGMCPVRKLLNFGLDVGLGTDVSGGDSPSVLDALRRAMDVSAHLQMVNEENCAALKWTEALYLATLGGAKALNLGDKIGSFEVGKEFDALVIDTSVWSDQHGYIPDYTRYGDPATNLVQRFVYIGDDRNIAKVFVKGYQAQTGSFDD